MLHRSTLLTALLAFAVLLSSCNKEGLINKTKYEGKKYVNTCDQFAEEVGALLEANAGPARLRVSEYDNSQFDYFFLEPGQFVQKNDTLYFRLINDLEYGKYLQKGVAILVHGRYEAQPHLKAIEKDPEGLLDTLIIDDYYLYENSEPFFVYKMPTNGKLDGKQIFLNFSVVKYKRNGELKKVFCKSFEMPLGPLDPSCCTQQPWRKSDPKSVVQIPELDIEDEEYRYKGFNGFLDLIFPMNKTKFDREELRDVILNYISKYEDLGYKLQGITMKGYASPGGTETYNQDLSERRVKVVYQDLVDHFEKINRPLDISIDSAGNGEDWNRFREMANKSDIPAELRETVLEIANLQVHIDDKEMKLKALPDEQYWGILEPKVFHYCRHVKIDFEFQYEPDRMYVEEYPQEMQIVAPQVYNVATKTMTVGRYTRRANVTENLGILNTLIDTYNNRKPNLFAMRSTYHFAQDNVKSAIGDIEQAMNMDRENQQYGLAALAYKTVYSDKYSMNERMEMLNDYNSFVLRFPNNKSLLYNRAVMMDKVGFISGALAEYDKILAGNEADAIALNNRGVAKLKASRLTEAEVDFQEALEKNPELVEAHFNLAVIHAYKGLTDEAAASLKAAIELDSAIKAQVCSNPVFRVMRQNPKFSMFGC